MRTYFFADSETTGVRPTDKVVEIAFIQTDSDFNVLNKDQSLIDPEMAIPAGASAVHHITNKDVEFEPTIEEYMHMKNNPLLFEDAVLVAHQASFDLRYLGPWMVENVETMCTLRLAKKLYPDLDSYKLGALRYSLGLPDFEGDAHRADADVGMLLNLVKHMVKASGLDLEGLLELQKAPLDIKSFPFGKWKGTPLADVPPSYLSWYLGTEKPDADIAASIRKIHPNL